MSLKSECYFTMLNVDYSDVSVVFSHSSKILTFLKLNPSWFWVIGIEFTNRLYKHLTVQCSLKIFAIS